MQDSTDSVSPGLLRHRRLLIYFALAVMCVVKLIAIFTLRVNSDEPQHLHVAWGWMHGILPYRDTFDNHAPLFHVFYAPLLTWIGERADIVLWMRCAVIPWYGLCLWLCFRLARKLFCTDVGILATALLALQPTFFSSMTEFRPDGAWAAVWMGAMLVGVQGPLTSRRGLLCGLLAGLAAAISIKTAILIAAALVAAAIVLAAKVIRHEAPGWRMTVRVGAAVAAGGALVPLAVASAFVLMGAAGAIFYCLLVHNAAPGLGRWQHLNALAWAFPVLVPLLLLAVHFSWKRAAVGDRFACQVWVLCTAVIYFTLRGSYQPMLDRQDVLPLVPMLTPFLSALLLHGLARTRTARVVAISAALLAESSMTAHLVRPWRVEASGYTQELRTLITLARPRDVVMDDKAESIFRSRPVYWILENVTLYRLKVGSIPDDIVAGLIRNRVAVGVFERETGRDQEFVQRNYLSVAPHVKVLGERFGTTDRPIDFAVAVQQQYRIVARSGHATGELDGSPYEASRELMPGPHRYVPDHRDEWGLEWDRAAALGYSPFAGSGSESLSASQQPHQRVAQAAIEPQTPDVQQ